MQPHVHNKAIIIESYTPCMQAILCKHIRHIACKHTRKVTTHARTHARTHTHIFAVILCNICLLSVAHKFACFRYLSIALISALIFACSRSLSFLLALDRSHNCSNICLLSVALIFACSRPLSYLLSYLLALGRSHICLLSIALIFAIIFACSQLNGRVGGT